MPPLRYHPGQLAIQEEANTRALAGNLAHWVGPVVEFARLADLILLAAQADDGALQFTTLSGPAPLIDETDSEVLRLRFPAGAALPPAGRYGGLVINLSMARRARINGAVERSGAACVLRPEETFTLCRKYMAPSVAVAGAVVAGPSARQALSLDDLALRGLVARAETAFLASVAPDGGPDVAHRGGPPGFLRFDPATALLEWPEYLGDGVFKSAGNVRATGRLTFLVPDFETGDALEIVCGGAAYTNIRASRHERLDPLVQEREAHPLQGTIQARVERVLKLTGAVAARRRIPKALRVTSCSTVDEQAPQ